MSTRSKVLTAGLVAVALGLNAGRALANVYPAQFVLGTANDDTPVCKTVTLTYYLNEDADGTDALPGVKIEVLEQPANTAVRTITIARQKKGRHVFEWDGRDDSGVRVPDGKTYKIRVTAADLGYSAWTQISTDNTATSFYGPLGVSVNRHEWSPNYGKIYVSNAVANVAAPSNTAFGRPTQDGIYVLNADASENMFTDAGKDWPGGLSTGAMKSHIGPDDHLYVVEFFNDRIYEFNDAMTSTTEVIGDANRTTGQWVEGVWVEGTQAAGNRVIYAVNSRFTDARRGLIRYELGSAATASGTGTQYIGPTYFDYYPRDVGRDASGNWYMNQFRSSPNQAPALTKFLDSATLPINTAAWELDKANTIYTGAFGLDILDSRGWVAYGHYYSGEFLIFNMSDGSPVARIDAGSRLREVAFDAAGNIYTVDNLTEWLRIWSPPDGPNSMSTTTKDAVSITNGTGGPVITSEPVDAAFCASSPQASFSVGATGTNLTYQWKLEGVPLTDGTNADGVVVSGANQATLSLNNVPTSYNNATLTVVVCEATGVWVSKPVQLRIGASFIQPPFPQVACVGDDVVFKVIVAGSGTISYQWQSDNKGDGNFVDIGTNSDTLVLNGVLAAMSGNRYRVIVNDDCNTPVTSPPATLTVRSGPAIAAVAFDVSIAKGSNYTIISNVVVTGTPHYQWKKVVGDQLVNVGTDQGIYQITGATCADAGSYRLEVTDDCGTTLSQGDAGTAVITVTTSDPETCGNGTDDDCDGLIDCADSACSALPECQPCNTPWADAAGATGVGLLMGDGDVDSADFGHFQFCFTGSAGNIPAGAEYAYCECFDRNNDGDVDLDDLAAFTKCVSGPAIAWVPSEDCP